jgi:hypothetical protein
VFYSPYPLQFSCLPKGKLLAHLQGSHICRGCYECRVSFVRSRVWSRSHQWTLEVIFNFNNCIVAVFVLSNFELFQRLLTITMNKIVFPIGEDDS